MSDVSEHADVNLMLADFAMAETGKVNVIGGGVSILGFDPRQGMTSRFTLVAQVFLEDRHCPAEFTLELTLVDEAGDLVEVPGPAGPQKMRIGHVTKINKAVTPQGVWIRPGASRGMAQVILDFGNGLPLVPGERYEWRVRIDLDDQHAWSYPIAVAGTPREPVLG